jgi:POT family proton-dependent oligopeptide transporter
MLLSLLIFTLFFRRLPHARQIEGGARHHEEVEGDAASTSESLNASSDRLLRFGQWFNMVTVTLLLAWLLWAPTYNWPESIRDIALWPTHMWNFLCVWIALEIVTVLIFLSGGDLVSANAAKLKAVFIIVALFWMAFHQNSVTLTFFAADHTRREFLGKVHEPEEFSAINPAFILLFSPLMVWLWSALARRGREPSSTSKMILAMFVTGLAYAVMVAAGRMGGDTGEVSPFWLVGCYALLTIAELWLSPIGLSLTSKLAPPRYRGLWMGFWFLATSVGNKLVHVVGQYWDEVPPSQLFLVLVVSSIGGAITLDYILINLRRFGPPSTEA